MVDSEIFQGYARGCGVERGDVVNEGGGFAKVRLPGVEMQEEKVLQISVSFTVLCINP